MKRKIPGWFPLAFGDLIVLLGIASIAYTITKELTDNPNLAVLIAANVLILSAILWAVSRIWQDTRNRFSVMDIERGKEGAEVSKCCRKANKTIRVTHFGKQIPTEAHTNLLLKKLDEGIRVSRIVSKNTLKDQKVLKWLNRFKGHKNYRQYNVPFRNLPINFSIYDSKIVVLYLPSSLKGVEFNNIIRFNNRVVASFFRIMYNCLISEPGTEEEADGKVIIHTVTEHMSIPSLFDQGQNQVLEA